MSDGLSRAYDFLTRADMAGERTEPTRFGTAVYDDRVPKRYDSNYLLVETVPPGTTALRLADVDDTGYARFLTDGIVRGRYRESTAAPALLEPGKAYKYAMDLWATGNLFKAGHRIRLYVSSSSFPRFDRNRNTGEPIATATRSVRARQTIYMDKDRPSALLLPVVPGRGAGGR